MTKADIRKAGGVVIRDRKFLVTRSYGKDFFIAPGGKLENDETPIQALAREIEEEIQVKINTDTLEHIGTFQALAAGKENSIVEMYVYIIGEYEGEISPSSEVEEIRWIDTNTHDIEIGSIFERDVMPLLQERGLID
jgi:8-oxo-dGTP pyrophosphatase MutT (NUDIX family)